MKNAVFLPVGFHLLFLPKPPGQVSCFPVGQSLTMIIWMRVLLRVIMMRVFILMMMRLRLDTWSGFGRFDLRECSGPLAMETSVSRSS